MRGHDEWAVDVGEQKVTVVDLEAVVGALPEVGLGVGFEA